MTKAGSPFIDCLCVVPCGEENGARHFSRGGDAPGFVRWNDRQLLAQVNALGGLETGGKGVRVLGEYIADKICLFSTCGRRFPFGRRGKKH